MMLAVQESFNAINFFFVFSLQSLKKRQKKINIDLFKWQNVNVKPFSEMQTCNIDRSL